MAYEWARPGIKCVCVDDRLLDLETPLVRGRTYEIISVLPSRKGLLGPYKRPSCLVKVRGVYNPYSTDGAFAINRFRPLISQADDVEMFRRISEDSVGRLEVLEDVLNEQYLCDETHE